MTYATNISLTKALQQSAILEGSNVLLIPVPLHGWKRCGIEIDETMRIHKFLQYVILAEPLLPESSKLQPETPSCRNLPGDKDWPSGKDWQTLNTSLSGRLIQTQPAAHVCHDPTYNEEACATVKENWIYPWGHFNDPSGFVAAYQQNASCDPYTPRETPCFQGNYVEYAIDVHEVADVVAGIKFAQQKNIRLVIKNTGHDYLGKSTGKGALSLWMHNLKAIEFLNYTSDTYIGPAVKMGAGVQSFEAYTAANEVGLNVIGGHCLTVGIVGGYSQGGGHSLLSGKYGMGADQALEWEVVTADGTVVIASPSQHSDLYWALSGGGGGTYGVVLSLISRAYPDNIVGGATLSFTSPSGLADDDLLWQVVAYFHQVVLPGLVDAGAHVQWAVAGPVFLIGDLTIPGATEANIYAELKPLTDHLASQGIRYQLNVTSFPTFYEHSNYYGGPFPYGTFWSAQIQGGVLISRDTAISNTTGLQLIDQLRHLSTATNFNFGSYSARSPVENPSIPANAVHPGWRNLLSCFIIFQQWNYSAPFEVMDEQERQLTEEIMPPFQDLASGAYLNEADFNNPRWKEEFYGRNWERLSQIKRKWDPKGLLYAKTAVGSETWTLDAKGRLCRAD